MFKKNRKNTGAIDPKILFVLIAVLILVVIASSYILFSLYQSQVANKRVEEPQTVAEKVVTPPAKVKKVVKKEVPVVDLPKGEEKTGEPDVTEEGTPVEEDTPERGDTLRAKVAKVFLDLRAIVTGRKQKEPQESLLTGRTEERFTDPILDDMPPRTFERVNPITKESDFIVVVDEVTYAQLREDAQNSIGKTNPFIEDGNTFTPFNVPTQSSEKTAENIASSLPTIPVPPKTTTIPVDQGIEMPPPPDIPTGAADIPEVAPIDQPVDTAPQPQQVIASVSLTGIVDKNTVLLKVGNQSRALRIGENFKGILLVGVQPNQATLRYQGEVYQKVLNK